MTDEETLSFALRRKLADELENARADLERLGAVLCEDAALTVRHMTALQSLDMIGQKQMAIAAILRATDPESAVASSPLESLRLRLESRGK